jgi:hypothetical protein
MAHQKLRLGSVLSYPRRAPMPDLTVLIGLKVTPEDVEDLDAIRKRFQVAMTRQEVVRVAMRIGLRAIAADPSLLLSPPEVEAPSPEAAKPKKPPTKK